jgi:hypothetical protein
MKKLIVAVLCFGIASFLLTAPPATGAEPGVFTEDSVDKQLLGIWFLQPGTKQYETHIRTREGKLEVTEKLSPGEYRVSASSRFMDQIRYGYEWSSGPCSGKTTCRDADSSSGTLKISGSSVTISYSNPEWSDDRLTLSGRKLSGKDNFGPMVYIKK